MAAKSLSTIIKTTNYMMSELTLALTDKSHPLAMHAHNLLVCPGAICTEKTWIFDVRAYEINFSSLRTLGSRKRGHTTSCKRSIGPVTLIVAKDLEPVDQCPPFGFDAWYRSLVANVMTPVRVFTFPNLDAKGRGRMLAASKAHLRKLQNGDDFSIPGGGNWNDTDCVDAGEADQNPGVPVCDDVPQCNGESPGSENPPNNDMECECSPGDPPVANGEGTRCACECPPGMVPDRDTPEGDECWGNDQ